MFAKTLAWIALSVAAVRTQAQCTDPNANLRIRLVSNGQVCLAQIVSFFLLHSPNSGACKFIM
jgi:hypothetical protein